MKQVSLLILSSLLLFSCSKKADDGTESSTANFSITGIKDVDLTLTSNGQYTFQVQVVPTSGAKDTVTLFGDNFPNGVYADFQPRTGVTPFTSTVTISTDFKSGVDGIVVSKIKGSGNSGVRSYDMKINLDAYRGWQLGSAIYEKVGLEKTAGNDTTYARVKVISPTGAALYLSFALKAGLPTATSTYTIANDTGKKSLRIAMYEGAHIWSATGKAADGSGPATGTFTFDTLHKFTFKCSNVEMSDGIQKVPLKCSFSE
jgi:hypothetical protein